MIFFLFHLFHLRFNFCIFSMLYVDYFFNYRCYDLANAPGTNISHGNSEFWISFTPNLVTFLFHINLCIPFEYNQTNALLNNTKPKSESFSINGPKSNFEQFSVAPNPDATSVNYLEYFTKRSSSS